MTALAALPDLPPDVWERRPTDTDRSWEAFTQYLEMGVTRSVTRAAKELGKDKGQMIKWSHTHDWKARAHAWDRAQDEQISARLMATRWATADRWVTLARQFEGKVAQRLATLDPATMTPAEVAQWLRIAVQIERDVYFPKDESPNAVAVAQIVIDGRTLSPPTQQPMSYIVDSDDGGPSNGSPGNMEGT